MKTKKGLVISWYFPPINSSEGLCTFKLLKNSKFSYDVFTQKNNKTWSYDTNEDKLTAKNINTIFSEETDINKWVIDGIEKFSDKLDGYDFIMSRSMAPESHEIALELKRRNKDVLWIASFGDPIDKNPYMKLIEEKNPNGLENGILSYSFRYVLSPKRILKKLLWDYRTNRYRKNHTRFYKDQKLQDDILNECDIIIFNNKYQMEFMLDGYSDEIKEKGLLLHHGYDKDFYSKKEKRNDNKFKISYLGHLDEIRTPKNFLKALKRLKETKKDLYDKLSIEIYGNMADKDKVLLVDYDLCDVVKFQKPVKYFESLEKMQNSDLLLLVDANLASVNPKNIFYAAKLADYIGSGSNILGITMTEGPSADIIKEVGGVIASHSVEDIYTNLVLILEGKHKLKTDDKKGNYDMVNISKLFDDRVNSFKN